MPERSALTCRPLSQDGLKLIACVTMLLDHIGATVVLEQFYLTAAAGGNAQQLLDLYNTLRLVGRLAFPIYCFLLTEGVHYTHSPRKYAARLAAAALIAELPYDLALHGTMSWENQSVMITLLLGFFALQVMKRTPRILLKLLLALPFALLAEWMHTDYGADGIWVIVLFSLTRDWRHRELWHFFGLWMIFSPNHLMMLNWLGGASLMTQELACLAAVPIAFYSGEKRSRSKALQLAFYLFYPVHLTILWLIQEVAYG